MSQAMASQAIIDRLLAALRGISMSPSEVIHGASGGTVLRWYVDDDSDRFVEVRSSTSSGDAFCLARDRREAQAVVLPGDVDQLVTWVGGRLDELAARSREMAGRTTRRGT